MLEGHGFTRERFTHLVEKPNRTEQKLYDTFYDDDYSYPIFEKDVFQNL